MPELLLQTKLYIPPLRPGLVPRPHLLGRLDQALKLGHALSLISAPAGFGKTTLVAEWLSPVTSQGIIAAREAAPPAQVAWLALDEGDNDLSRFLEYFIAALNGADDRETAIGQGALSMLRSPQPPAVEELLTLLINDISDLPGRVILVFDDYHVINSTAVDDALSFLLNHLPAQLHLVLATREDPDLPLARLRAGGQMTEMRAADLRFSHAEVAQFLNQTMGLNLSEENVAALESSTEGWIAGLQLAAISMQGRDDAGSFIESFTGGHRHVLDYLIEEVLERQPETIQEFLLHTSILDRLTGSLCDAITGQASNGRSSDGSAVTGPASDGQVTLEMLEHANLFVVGLDEERRWYRYHHLFADLLRRRMRQIQPEMERPLHRLASQWYEENGYPEEAIKHTLWAGDFERATLLIEREADEWWQSGQHTKLRRWLDALPAELLLTKPHLCVLRAWDYFTTGQQEAAETCLTAAEKALADGADPLSDLDARIIQGRAAAVRAFLAIYRGDVQGTYDYSNQALEHLPEDDLSWRSTALVALGDAYSFFGDIPIAYKVRKESFHASEAAGNVYMTLLAGMKLAITMRQLAMLEQAVTLCRQQFQLAQSHGLRKTVVVGWLLAIWGETLVELNDLAGARHNAQESTRLIQQGGDLAMIGWSNLCLIRIHFSLGDLPAAEEVIRRVESTAQEKYVPPWIADRVAAWQANIWLATGKQDAAAQWTAERGLDTSGELAYLEETAYIIQARVLIAQNRSEEAVELLDRLLQGSEDRGYVSRILELLILQGLAFQTMGDVDGAVSVIQRLLPLAEQGGYVRTLADEGRPMEPLLRTAISYDIRPEYARRVLAAIRMDRPAHSDKPELPIDQSALFESLSERELEVLQLIGLGLTNSEIAARLYLSLNTVKVHTRNIYSKLDVHSRTQAISRAHELGLLSRDRT